MRSANEQLQWLLDELVKGGFTRSLTAESHDGSVRRLSVVDGPDGVEVDLVDCTVRTWSRGRLPVVVRFEPDATAKFVIARSLRDAADRIERHKNQAPVTHRELVESPGYRYRDN